MGKRLYVIWICLVVAIAFTAFAGCSNGGHNGKFVGTWYEVDSEGHKKNSKLVLTKNGEGSFTQDGLSGNVNWHIEKNKLFLSVSMCGMTETDECSYEFSGNKLILTESDGDVSTFIRAKD